MITAQDIDRGVTAVPAVSQTPVATTSETAPFSTPEASGETTTQSVPSIDSIKLNPRTVLDPDLNIFVAQYEYAHDISFQIPSRNRIEAYQAAQSAHWTEQTVVQPRETAESLQAAREITHNGGDGVAEQQGAATVTAAAVGAVSATAETGTIRREDNSNPAGRPVAPSTVHQVDLEG